MGTRSGELGVGMADGIENLLHLDYGLCEVVFVGTW